MSTKNISQLDRPNEPPSSLLDIVNQSHDLHNFLLRKIGHSLKLILVIVDEDLTITDYNHGFSELIQNSAELRGTSFRSLLLPESRLLFSSSTFPEQESLRINFQLGNQSSASLNCHLMNEQTQLTIIGEQPIFSDSDVVQKMTVLMNELTTLTRELNHKNIALKKARDEIKSLHGIIPICMHCKEIRDDQGYWNKLEKYISERSDAEFSHGICPDCLQEHYPDYT